MADDNKGKTRYEYAKLITSNLCKQCGEVLNTNGNNIQYYPHNNGWLLKGIFCSDMQWLYIHCDSCGYDTSLEELGVVKKWKKIYLASSWKMATVVKELADKLRMRGHEVDAFCDDEDGERVSFDWDELFIIMKDEGIDISKEDAKTMMEHWRVKEAFEEDKKFIDWADVLILLLPSGRSSHLEAGYAAGLGKRVYIIGGYDKGEFETMYGFADEMYYYEETHKMFNDLISGGNK